MTFQPTEEQLAIVEAAKRTQDNLLISALAGAAKTSTLELIAHALPQGMLCLAFNKKIKEEMERRLPSHCTTATLNGLGYRTWMEFTRIRKAVDTSKTYRLVKQVIEEGFKSKREQGEAFKVMADLIRWVDQGKTAGWIPEGEFKTAEPLLTDEEFFASLDEETTPTERDIIRAVSILSVREGHAGIVDFNDQILLPTVFQATFTGSSLVLIDEAQDLSELNHKMLKKIVKKRLIAVGDECQAIYAFRGASENSMSELREAFNMRELKLTMTFRCPSNIVAEAKWRAPDMQYFREGGGVTRLPTGLWWHADLFPEGSAIICRNNSPLFSLAIKLLKAGRYPELIGNDIGKTLLKVLSKLGDHSMRQPDVLLEISVWEEAKLAKTRTPGRIMDQAECLRIFARAATTLGGAIAYAENIFKMQGPIKLMTGHKSKGLEFDHVFLLDTFLLSPEGQDRNLKYVMQTRAKETLCYLESEDYSDAKPHERLET